MSRKKTLRRAKKHQKSCRGCGNTLRRSKNKKRNLCTKCAKGSKISCSSLAARKRRNPVLDSGWEADLDAAWEPDQESLLDDDWEEDFDAAWDRNPAEILAAGDSCDDCGIQYAYCKVCNDCRLCSQCCDCPQPRLVVGSALLGSDDEAETRRVILDKHRRRRNPGAAPVEKCKYEYAPNCGNVELEAKITVYPTDHTMRETTKRRICKACLEYLKNDSAAAAVVHSSKKVNTKRNPTDLGLSADFSELRPQHYCPTCGKPGYENF